MADGFLLHAAILNKNHGLGHGWFRKRAKCERDREGRDKRAAETETTGLAYVNTSMCAHNHIIIV